MTGMETNNEMSEETKFENYCSHVPNVLLHFILYIFLSKFAVN